MAAVMIRVDPHKAPHAAAAIGRFAPMTFPIAAEYVTAQVLGS